MVSGEISPRRARIFSIPFSLRESRISTAFSSERFIHGRCAILSTPYLCFISDAILIVLLPFFPPPAPYVTLMKSGFKSESSSRAL